MAANAGILADLRFIIRQLQLVVGVWPPSPDNNVSCQCWSQVNILR